MRALGAVGFRVVACVWRCDHHTPPHVLSTRSVGRVGDVVLCSPGCKGLSLSNVG